MKLLSTVILMATLLGSFQVVNADESNNEPDILAKRGKGIVSQDEFAARAAQIPEKHRLQVLRDRNRFRDTLNNLLLSSQLAADAREAERRTSDGSRECRNTEPPLDPEGSPRRRARRLSV